MLALRPTLLSSPRTCPATALVLSPPPRPSLLRWPSLAMHAAAALARPWLRPSLRHTPPVRAQPSPRPSPPPRPTTPSRSVQLTECGCCKKGSACVSVTTHGCMQSGQHNTNSAFLQPLFTVFSYCCCSRHPFHCHPQLPNVQCLTPSAPAAERLPTCIAAFVGDCCSGASLRVGATCGFGGVRKVVGVAPRVVETAGLVSTRCQCDA